MTSTTSSRTSEQFLEDGDKAKITIMFRGREITYVDQGFKIMRQLAEMVKDIAIVEAHSQARRQEADHDSGSGSGGGEEGLLRPEASVIVKPSIKKPELRTCRLLESDQSLQEF